VARSLHPLETLSSYVWFAGGTDRGAETSQVVSSPGTGGLEGTDAPSLGAEFSLPRLPTLVESPRRRNLDGAVERNLVPFPSGAKASRRPWCNAPPSPTMREMKPTKETDGVGRPLSLSKAELPPTQSPSSSESPDKPPPSSSETSA
jgi:hypothetical protein